MKRLSAVGVWLAGWVLLIGLPSWASELEPVVTVKSAGAEPREKLRLSPHKGDEQTVQLDGDFGMGMKAGAKQVPVRNLMTLRFILAIKVNNVAVNGDISYELTYLDVDVVYPPEVQAANDPDKAIRAINAIRGMHGHSVFSNRGINKSVEFEFPAGLDADLRQRLESTKQSIQQITAPLPEEAVGVGAVWQVESLMKANDIEWKQTRTVTLEKLSDDSFTYKVVTKLSAEPRDMKIPNLPAGAVAHFNSLSGTMDGRATWKKDGKFPLDAQSRMTVQTSMTATSEGRSQDIQFDMEAGMVLADVPAGTRLVSTKPEGGSDAGDKSDFVARGNVWFGKKDFEKAIKEYGEAIRLDPKNKDAFKCRGKSWEEMERYDLAIKDYDEAIRLDAKDGWAFRSRGNAWNKKKDYDKAIKDYCEAIRLNPKDKYAFSSRARAWEEKKEYDKAIDDYSEAIRLDPTNKYSLHARGYLWLVGKTDYNKAIKDFDEAIRVDPSDAVSFAWRGNAWSEKRNFDNAIKDYDEAIRLDPKDGRLLDFRGNASLGKRDYDRAMKDFDKAIRLDLQDSLAFAWRGDAWHRQKNFDLAMRDFDEAIRLDPQNDYAFTLRGDTWRDKREFARAIDDYNQAIRLDQKDAWPRVHRAVMQMLAGQEEAAASFQEALAFADWKGKDSLNAVIFGYFAARLSRDEAHAKQFLKDSAGKLDDVWPYPVVKFLRGEISEPALLAGTSDDAERSFAQCCLGFSLELGGDVDEAKTRFQWVKDHDETATMAYWIALAELKRLATR